MRRLQGAYSLVILTEDRSSPCVTPSACARSASGRMDDGWVIASESCALDHIGASLSARLSRAKS